MRTNSAAIERGITQYCVLTGGPNGGSVMSSGDSRAVSTSAASPQPLLPAH